MMAELWKRIKAFLTREWKTRSLKEDIPNSKKQLINIRKMKTKKEIVTKYAWHYLGIPYRWGGDDFSGFDCSGLCMELLQAIGLVGRKEDLTAQGIYNRFQDKEVNEPEEGCLVFYGIGKNHITHIEYCIDKDLSIGASGGGSGTLTVEDAIRQNAFIKIRPIRSRKDIVAYVNPFLTNV